MYYKLLNKFMTTFISLFTIRPGCSDVNSCDVVREHGASYYSYDTCNHEAYDENAYPFILFFQAFGQPIGIYSWMPSPLDTQRYLVAPTFSK